MDAVPRDIQGDIPWCMLFVYDVVLLDGSWRGVNRKLEVWRQTLELRGFRLIVELKRYVRCAFNTISHKEVSLDGQVVSQKDKFRY